MREIILDTEVSGLTPEAGDKLIEIGAIELIDGIPTGKMYHQYINPDKEIDETSVSIHGLSSDFLKNYPTFSQIADEFLEFIGNAAFLIAHNAFFDMKFINYELTQANKKPIPNKKFIDTFELAKSIFPGARNNFIAVCDRLNIKMPEDADKTIPSILQNCQLLSLVYPELLKKIANKKIV